MADNNTDPAKLRQEINAENEDQREAMMKGVYAGPDAMSMMMVYAGPAPDGTIQGGMAAKMRQGGINPQPTPQPREETYCFCPTCGAMCTLIYCPECGTMLKDVQRYRDCSGCGARINADAKFCHECGKPAGSGNTMMA